MSRAVCCIGFNLISLAIAPTSSPCFSTNLPNHSASLSLTCRGLLISGRLAISSSSLTISVLGSSSNPPHSSAFSRSSSASSMSLSRSLSGLSRFLPPMTRTMRPSASRSTLTSPTEALFFCLMAREEEGFGFGAEEEAVRASETRVSTPPVGPRRRETRPRRR